MATIRGERAELQTRLQDREGKLGHASQLVVSLQNALIESERRRLLAEGPPGRHAAACLSATARSTAPAAGRSEKDWEALEAEVVMGRARLKEAEEGRMAVRGRLHQALSLLEKQTRLAHEVGGAGGGLPSSSDQLAALRLGSEMAASARAEGDALLSRVVRAEERLASAEALRRAAEAAARAAEAREAESDAATQKSETLAAAERALGEQVVRLEAAGLLRRKLAETEEELRVVRAARDAAQGEAEGLRERNAALQRFHAANRSPASRSLSASVSTLSLSSPVASPHRLGMQAQLWPASAKACGHHAALRADNHGNGVRGAQPDAVRAGKRSWLPTGGYRTSSIGIPGE